MPLNNTMLPPAYIEKKISMPVYIYIYPHPRLTHPPLLAMCLVIHGIPPMPEGYLNTRLVCTEGSCARAMQELTVTNLFVNLLFLKHLMHIKP